VPDKSDGMPFINSNPAVPLPTGEVDSATIRPLPTSGQGGQACKFLVALPQKHIISLSLSLSLSTFIRIFTYVQVFIENTPLLVLCAPHGSGRSECKLYCGIMHACSYDCAQQKAISFFFFKTKIYIKHLQNIQNEV
jgi:hypothetical protein